MAVGKFPAIFFFHNPKSGGTSVKKLISKTFFEDEISPNIENGVDDHRFIEGKYNRFKGYKLYAGHYGRDIFEATASEHMAITSFRNPIERIISLYNYFRFSIELEDRRKSETNFRAVMAAKTMSFDDFVQSDDEYVLLYTKNFHARQLSRSPYEDFVEPIEKLFGFIDLMGWFYVCEWPDASMRWAAEIFEMPGLRITRENAQPPYVNSDLSKTNLRLETAQKIKDLNYYDFALYNYAVERLVRCRAPIETRVLGQDR